MSPSIPRPLKKPTGNTYSSGSSPSSNNGPGATAQLGSFNVIYYSPICSPIPRRKVFKMEDTKNRLFGPPQEESPKKIKNHMKSNIFSSQDVTLSQPPSPRKFNYIRRNPITGEVYDDMYDNLKKVQQLNYNQSGSLSLPSTPLPIRYPPGGKTSAIFY